MRDFLPKAASSGTVRRAFDVPGSVKDAIEACGVPHTEVDLIIADGRPVDFAHLVDDGDRIGVFPLFESIDVSAITKVRPDPLQNVRFVADGHLGRLAKLLRLLGFDTLHRSDATAPELVRTSVRDRRVILTRNTGLLKRSAVTHGYYVRATDPREQMAGVVRRFHLTDRIDPFTRCVECNGALAPVSKAEIADRLPPGTRRRVDEFHICPSCGKLYWRGAHYAELLRIVESARRAEGGDVHRAR